VRPVLFSIGGHDVWAWGTLVAIATAVGWFVVHRDLARKGVPAGLALSLACWGLLGGLVGARLWVAAHRAATLGAVSLRLLTGGGFAWYGGLAGGVLATLLPIRRAGVPWLGVADSAALGLGLALAIGRVGCHLAGDGDWGTPTRVPWGVAYPNGIVPWPHPPGVVVHPAALYESAASIALFAALWRVRARLARPGTLFAWYLVLAGAIRFAIEFVRTNPPVLAGLTEAQWASAALGVGGALWLGRASRA
jgi:phosphatidylglycerol:prolipoprotein diacylglycerol transferase